MKKQNGFSVVIVLLSILVVTAIGFTGYYVWNTQQDKNNKQETEQAPTSNSSASSTTTTATEPASNTPTADSSAGYLVINEWGVKIAMPSSEKATYTFYKPVSGTETQSLIGVDYNSSVSAYAKSDTLTDKNCSELGVTMYRTTQKPDDSWQNKKIGDYYFIVTGSPAMCSNSQQDETIRKDIIGAFIPNNVVPM